jgi:isocitrate dehydrogenase kinase/phosphatase
VSDCVFRDLPRARNEEEEMSAEPWFHCGPRDIFPEQWLQFLSIPAALSEVFVRQHGSLLTAAWWRAQVSLAPAAASALTASALPTSALPTSALTAQSSNAA